MSKPSTDRSGSNCLIQTLELFIYCTVVENTHTHTHARTAYDEYRMSVSRLQLPCSYDEGFKKGMLSTIYLVLTYETHYHLSIKNRFKVQGDTKLTKFYALKILLTRILYNKTHVVLAIN